MKPTFPHADDNLAEPAHNSMINAFLRGMPSPLDFSGVTLASCFSTPLDWVTSPDLDPIEDSSTVETCDFSSTVNPELLGATSRPSPATKSAAITLRNAPHPHEVLRPHVTPNCWMRTTTLRSTTHMNAPRTSALLNFLRTCVEIVIKTDRLTTIRSRIATYQRDRHPHKGSFRTLLSFALSFATFSIRLRPLKLVIFQFVRRINTCMRQRLHHCTNFRQTHHHINDCISWPARRSRLNTITGTVSNLLEQLCISIHQLLNTWSVETRRWRINTSFDDLRSACLKFQKINQVRLIKSKGTPGQCIFYQ